MNKKTTITIIIILLLLAAAAGVMYWYWQSQQNNTITTNTPIGVAVDDSVDNINLPILEDPSLGDSDVGQNIVPEDTGLVTNVYYFVERFGTYSNITDFQNIEDIKYIMSSDFYDQIIVKRKNLSFEDTSTLEYEAYDAKVTKVEWLDNTDIRATAKVTTRRHRITENENEPYSQDIIVRLSKIGDNWLVVEAIWQ